VEQVHCEHLPQRRHDQVVQPRRLALGARLHDIEDLGEAGAHELPLDRAVATDGYIGEGEDTAAGTCGMDVRGRWAKVGEEDGRPPRKPRTKPPVAARWWCPAATVAMGPSGRFLRRPAPTGTLRSAPPAVQ
jgi:hypothetical protein